MSTSWKDVWSRHQRVLPRNATPQERGRATQAAAAEYHGRPMRRNPGGISLGMILALGAAVVFGPKLLGAGTDSPPKVDNPVPGQVYGDWEYVLFSDSSLGKHQSGTVYLQTITPGWRNVKTGETRKA